MTEYVVVKILRAGQEKVVARCDTPEAAYTIRHMYEQHFNGHFIIREQSKKEEES